MAEGCNNGCTFCIIPKVRGAFRSRTIESIKAEVERLAAAGVKEVVLIAQDTTSYGIDLNDGKPLLTTLLKELTAVEGIEWIRMLYLYPTFFSDELLDLIVNEPKLCKYVDIPLQHVNNDILKQMNRRDDRNDIERLLKKIRNAPTHITLRTSIIVGFPGETDEQFEELCDFVKEIKFDNMGVFTYSQEEGTLAGAREDQVPEEVKEERFHRFMQLQQEISAERLKQKIGQTLDVIVDEIDDEGIIGRTKADAPEVDGLVYIENLSGTPVKVGEFIKVTITHSDEYDLWGTC
ncbi:30S ribosomal protein S12 methylthiotransferase RimO [uncultured Haemophilus sp.]|uniref:30S ribosomal protein S12 methylthiotransferase RimO n=1 Tax=uncultured Haemophilus sp. TaxID=237779 RepID=UPI0027DC73DD|nr:30S ribosomal protein S12 methylthiotransferase RimO [uncultured Haemophilus sp.]